MEKFFLETSDGKRIAADYYRAEGAKGVVYLHMMPATKESWSSLAGELQSIGISGLAIDLRGHGESDSGPDGFLRFGDEEHQKSILDVEAAVGYLRDKGIAEENIFLVGASIGANLVLVWLAANHSHKKAVALSPGLNYRGVDALAAVKGTVPGQEILFAAAQDDPNVPGNEAMVRALSEAVPSGVRKEIAVYGTGGHGTDILSRQPQLVEAIKKFISGEK